MTMAMTIRNTVSLTRRNLVHISREPVQLSDATIQALRAEFLAGG